MDGEASKLERECQNAACWHQCSRRDELSKIPAASICIPRPSSSCLLPLGGSPGSAGGPDLGSCRMTTSVLILELERLYVRFFQSGISVSHSPPAFPNVSPTSLQSQVFWGLIFPAQEPRAREPSVWLRPLAPWGEPRQSSSPSSLWVVPWGTWVLPVLGLCSPCFLSCGSFLVSLVVEDLLG